MVDQTSYNEILSIAATVASGFASQVELGGPRDDLLAERAEIAVRFAAQLIKAAKSAAISGG